MTAESGSGPKSPSREINPLTLNPTMSNRQIVAYKGKRNVTKAVANFNSSNKSKSKPKSKTTIPRPLKHYPPMVIVSECARDYARALANPFDGPLACVPCDFLNSNLINRTYVKGTFACGSQIGFICLDPKKSAFNDQPCVISSKSTFTGTNMDLNATADINLDSSNSAYSSTLIGVNQGDLAYRIVASGLRIRYTGTELNLGGIVNALHDPTHCGMYLRNMSQMDGELQARRFAVSRKWTTILYRPVVSNEQALLETTPNFASTNSPTITNATSNWYMGFIVVPPSSTTFSAFEYEAFTVVEYQGRNIRGQRLTHADPAGFAGCVQAAASFAPSQQTSFETEKSFVQKVQEYIVKGISHIADDPRTWDAAARVISRHTQNPNNPYGYTGTYGIM